MIVRREQSADEAGARAVQAAAFARGAGAEPVEAALLDALRADPGWLPALSLVAVDGARVIGHVVCSRGHVDGVAVVGLGPIGVAPHRQGTGVGQALVHAVLGAADALDEPLVALLGSPAFYGRFGFVPSTDVGIAAPDPAWGAHFQVRPLTAFRADTTGTFQYAAPFAAL